MENKYKVLLFDKLQENYADFLAEWSALTLEELIEKSEEIYVTKMVKEHLPNYVYEDQAKWLLRFQNPLDIVRDRWMEENGIGTVHDEDISHAVWTAMDHPEYTEMIYDLATDADPCPGQDEPVTVRDFLKQHPNVSFDMMTPGGFVYLTPEKAKLLLSGQSVKGHPGSPEFAVEISAEELLNQEVSNADFSDGAWHLLSDYIRKQEQKQLPFEEVTMC